jgi:hypothetical protein
MARYIVVIEAAAFDGNESYRLEAENHGLIFYPRNPSGQMVSAISDRKTIDEFVQSLPHEARWRTTGNSAVFDTVDGEELETIELESIPIIKMISD